MKKTVFILLSAVFVSFAFSKVVTPKTKCSYVSMEHTRTPEPINQNSTDEKDGTGIRVALLLDTSNSMDGLINQAKSQLWEIVNELSLAKYGGKNPHLKIALYEYGNDGLEKSDGYIRKVLDFTNDLDLISEKLFALRTNGGSEYCGQVIKQSLDDLSWGKNEQDLNLIFIAGNEPFTQGNVSYKEACTDAKEKSVLINTIYCGNYQEGIASYWREGALLTGGDYSAIDHNEVQVYIVTPYDERIIILNQQLNDTYIYYGSQGLQKMELQSVQDKNAYELNEVVAVKRAVSKSKSVYNNSGWDLVDASKEKDFDYKKLDKSNLSAELKGKSTVEIQKYVEQQAVKRAEIQKEINDLNVKREQFIAESQKKTSGANLEKSILNSIRKQATSKKYSFD